MRRENLYRKPLIFLFVFLLAPLPAALAAVTYEFRQTNQSDFQNNSDGEVTGTGVIAGDRSRIELRKGSGHLPGSYIISRNDLQMVFVVDPLHKQFTEIDAAKIASAYGSGRIQITGLKSSLTQLKDHPMVAGFPTDHYRVSASYDITVMFGALPVRQSVVTTIDKWVTTAFGELTDPTISKTGNAAVDQLIETEIGKIKGFPLRQITTIQTTSSDVGQNPGSKLRLSPTRRQTTELLVTRIATTNADASMFEVPPSYAKVDPNHPAKAPPEQNLTMQP